MMREQVVAMLNIAVFVISNRHADSYQWQKGLIKAGCQLVRGQPHIASLAAKTNSRKLDFLY